MLPRFRTSPDGTASYTKSGLGLGTYTWSAAYGGNSNYNGSTSPAVSFTIAPAATALKLISNTSFVIGTNSTTVTAIVRAR